MINGSVTVGHGYTVFSVVLTVILLITSNYCGEYGEIDYFLEKGKINKKNKVLGIIPKGGIVTETTLKILTFGVITLYNGIILYFITKIVTMINL
jgi:hypothetical protein